MTAPVIAIIEDDSATVAAMAEVLHDEGFQTFQWRQATGAHELIKEANPNAVILDIRMENTRAGLSVLEALRNDRATRNIPIVVCTADQQFLEQWTPILTQHHCGVLAKPFRLNQLIREVQAVIAPPAPAPSATTRGSRFPPPVSAALPVRDIKQVIALVDEDGKGVSQLAGSVEAKGYDALPWRWGNKLFEMIARDLPDVVVIDTRPEWRHALWHVLRRLQHDPRTYNTPVILLTDPDAPVAGVSRYPVFTKPLNRFVLLQEIETLVGPPPRRQSQPPRRR